MRNSAFFRFEEFSRFSEIEKIESDLRNKLFKFEIMSLKSQKLTDNFRKNEILKSLKKLEDIRSTLYGFNLSAFFVGIGLVHISQIYIKRVLLYEMGKKAVIHILSCLGAGILFGYIYGRNVSYSFTLYNKYKNTKKRLINIDNDFERFYVFHSEQEFDE